MKLRSRLASLHFTITERLLPLVGLPSKEGRACVAALRDWVSCLQAQRLPAELQGQRVLLFAMGSKHWVEWAVFASCHLRQRGIASDLLYDPDEIEAFYPQAKATDNFWANAASVPGVRLYPVTDCDASFEEISAVESYAPAALAYELRVEEHDIHSDPDRYQKALADLIARMVKRVRFLISHLKTTAPYQAAICYSGLIAESKIYIDIVRNWKLRTFFVEGWGWRPGHLVFNENAAALEYSVRDWWERRGVWTQSHSDEIDSYVSFMNTGSRTKGLSQMVRIQGGDISQIPKEISRFLARGLPYVFVAPNVIGDTTTVRRETIFPSIKLWIRDLIEWAINNPSIGLIIRAHPAEVWMGEKCTTRIADYIAKQFYSLPENVLVVSSSDSVNTFAIAQNAHVALVWMSNAGADFVLRRIPTIAAARGGYAGLGMLSEPRNRAEYFSSLQLAIQQKEVVTDHAVQLAKEYMHLLHFILPHPLSGKGFRAPGMHFNDVAADKRASTFFDAVGITPSTRV